MLVLGSGPNCLSIAVTQVLSVYVSLVKIGHMAPALPFIRQHKRKQERGLGLMCHSVFPIVVCMKNVSYFIGWYYNTVLEYYRTLSYFLQTLQTQLRMASSMGKESWYFMEWDFCCLESSWMMYMAPSWTTWGP
jgi:hypothetical protein